MRTSLAALFAVLLAATAASADDTKPPAVTDVKPTIKGGNVTIEARITDETGVLSAVVHHRGKGGKVEDTNMIKNDFDDIFKATFSGSGDTEYWIETSDLLGNSGGYGSQSKPYAASGKPAKGGGTAVAAKEPPPAKEEKAAPPPKEEPPPPKEHHKKEPVAREEPPPAKEPAPAREPKKTAKASSAPVVLHRAPSTQPPEGQEFTLRMKIQSDSPVAVAILQAKPDGGALSNIPLTHTDGDSYEGKIPGNIAKGRVEYFIAAKNQAGAMVRKGDGDDNKSPYVLTFKAGSGASAGASASAAGPYDFTHLTLFRVLPGKPVVVRAQVVPVKSDGDMPDRVAVLWSGNDAQDQITDMSPDSTGGLGGFKAELPAQDEGAIFYQVVACDAGAAHCGVDTGSKRKWHGAAVAAQPGAAAPLPREAPSQKAPPSLPE